MMIRWQTADYAMSTLGDVGEVSHIGTYAPTEAIPEINLGGDFEYRTRRPATQRGTVGPDGPPPGEVVLLLAVRFSEGIPVVYELLCINAWLLNDDADTIDRWVVSHA